MTPAVALPVHTLTKYPYIKDVDPSRTDYSIEGEIQRFSEEYSRQCIKLLSSNIQGLNILTTTQRNDEIFRLTNSFMNPVNEINYLKIINDSIIVILKDSYIISPQPELIALPELDLSSVRNNYIIHNEEEIVNFLSKSTFLIPLLEEACMQVKKYFKSARVHLKVSHDHDSTEPFEELVAIIDTDLSVKDTIRQLDEFDANWWYDNIDRAQDLLIIRV